MTKQEILNYIKNKGVYLHGPDQWDKVTTDAVLSLRDAGIIRCLKDEEFSTNASYYYCFPEDEIIVKSNISGFLWPVVTRLANKI